ncbi:MAG: DUF4230 domain-containing protein [Anaerovoracaceae bacterium]
MQIIKKFFSVKIYLWITLLILILLAGFYFSGLFKGILISEEKVATNEMVQYIEKADEHVFLNVGITDVVKKEELNDKLSKVIPFTEKRKLLIINYEAKLGVKQKIIPVKKGKKKYLIEIPKYEVIGTATHKGDYELYDEDKGVFSQFTKDVDTGTAVVEAISIENQEKYIEKYKKLLNESAKEYFTALFQAVDKDIVLKFNFPE